MDGLEQELGNQIKIIRINIHESVGAELAPGFQVEFAPTFIFFDGQGNELWRTVGDIDAQRVRDSVK